jgi:hypothetical protein
MSGTPMFEGPETGDTGYWCTVCAVMYKFAASEKPEFQEVIDRAARDKDGREHWHRLAGDDRGLARAVAVAPTILGLDKGALPVCWSHMLTLRLLQAGGIDLSGSLPPGMNGGVPRIGRG